MNGTPQERSILLFGTWDELIKACWLVSPRDLLQGSAISVSSGLVLLALTTTSRLLRGLGIELKSLGCTTSMFLTELCPQALLGDGRVSRGRSTGREGASMPSNLELTKEILPSHWGQKNGGEGHAPS